MNTLNLLLFTTLSLDYRLLKSLLVGVFLSFFGEVKMVLMFGGFCLIMGALGGQFWKDFSLNFCVDFLGRQKVTRAAPGAAKSRQEPPRLSLPGP